MYLSLKTAGAIINKFQNSPKQYYKLVPTNPYLEEVKRIKQENAKR
jgi:hypothetical protein